MYHLVNWLVCCACRWLASALRSVIDDEEGEGYFYSSDGGRIDQEFAEKCLHKIEKIFEQGDKFSRKQVPVELENDSIGQFVQIQFDKQVQVSKHSASEKQIMAGLLRWRSCLLKSDNACSSMNDISLSAWGDYEECEGNNYVPLNNGYSSVLNAILKDIPKDKIRLNSPVESIQWQCPTNNNNSSAAQSNSKQPAATHPITVRTSAGDVIAADHVIVTCSLGA